MNKKLLLSAFVVTLGIAGAASMSQVHAQELSDSSNPVVQKLVQKFGLKEADVQAVFDEVHEEHKTEMKQRMDERLSQAVTNGKITEEQKQKIISKMTELQSQREANRETMKDKTPEERKTQMEAEKASLEAWAKENGLSDMSLFMIIKPMGHGAPHHMVK